MGTFLRHGTWNGRSIVSEKWTEMARTPGPANEMYGYANWFLNTGKKALPAAPASAVYFEGNGANVIYMDWENDVVAVGAVDQRRLCPERFRGQDACGDYRFHSFSPASGMLSQWQSVVT